MESANDSECGKMMNEKRATTLKKMAETVFKYRVREEKNLTQEERDALEVARICMVSVAEGLERNSKLYRAFRDYLDD